VHVWSRLSAKFPETVVDRLRHHACRVAGRAAGARCGSSRWTPATRAANGARGRAEPLFNPRATPFVAEICAFTRGAGRRGDRRRGALRHAADGGGGGAAGRRGGVDRHHGDVTDCRGATWSGGAADLGSYSTTFSDMETAVALFANGASTRPWTRPFPLDEARASSASSSTPAGEYAKAICCHDEEPARRHGCRALWLLASWLGWVGLVQVSLESHR